MSGTDKSAVGWRWWRIDVGGLGVCAALTLVMYVLAVEPLLAHRADMVDRQRELDVKNREASKLFLSLTSLKRELAIVQQTLADSPLRLQPTSAVNQRLALITSMAGEHELTLDEIKPGRPASGTHYDTVPIVLSGTGTYRTCAAFMHRLHQTFADVGVSAFTVSGQPANPEAPATFRLSLAWFAAPVGRAPAQPH